MFRQSSKSGLILPRSSMVNPYTAQGLPAVYGRIAKNVRLFFDYSEGTGSKIYSKAGGGFFGTLDAGGGGNSIEQMWSNGRPGALDFDGATDQINLNDKAATNFLHGAENVNSFQSTVIFWVKLDNPDGNNLWVLFDTNGGTGNRPGAAMWVDDRSSLSRNRTVAYIIGARAGQQIINIVGTNNCYPDDTKYHMIAVTHDQALANTNMKLYIDAVYINSANKSAFTPNTSASTDFCHIGTGAYTSAYGWMSGAIASSVFLDAALDADTLLTMYNYERQFLR